MKVVNKRTHTPQPNDYYIGRPSPLGNPFSHMDLAHTIKCSSRQEAVDKYEQWLRQEIAKPQSIVRAALKAIPKDANLVCWCAPLACHGDVIKKIIEEGL